jgi:hypothetical protein
MVLGRPRTPNGLRSLLRHVAAALLALLLGAAPESAAAGKKIVVAPFSGPGGGEASSALVRSLSGRFQVVPYGQYSKEARRRNVKVGSPEGRSTAARALGLTGVVEGRIERSGDRPSLKLSVFSADNGRLVAGPSFLLSSSRLDAGTVSKITSAVSLAMQRARSGAPPRGGGGPAVVASARTRPAPRAAARPRHTRSVAARPAPSPAPPPRPAASGGGDGSFDDGSEVAPKPAPRRGGSGGGGEDDDVFEDGGGGRRSASTPGQKVASARSGAGSSDDLGFESEGSGSQGGEPSGSSSFTRRTSSDAGTEEKVLKKSEERPIWEKIAELGVGLMFIKRKFDFNDPVEHKPPNYNSPMVPAFQIDAAIYPLSYFRRGPLANLGVVGRFYRVFYMKSLVQNLSSASDPLRTTLQDFQLGLRYRWNILGRRTSLTIKPGVDFGRLSFIIWDDIAHPVSLPDVTYYYLQLALVGLEMPFYTSGSGFFTFGGTANFSYQLIFSAGEIERTDGAGYGHSSTGGIDVNGGIYTTLGNFFIKANGFYRRIFFSFDQSCGSVCKLAGGALDIYAGLVISGGYAY